MQVNKLCLNISIKFYSPKISWVGQLCITMSMTWDIVLGGLLKGQIKDITSINPMQLRQQSSPYLLGVNTIECSMTYFQVSMYESSVS